MKEEYEDIEVEDLFEDDLEEATSGDEPIITEEEAGTIAIEHLGGGDVVEVGAEFYDGNWTFEVMVETEEGLIEVEIDGEDGTILEEEEDTTVEEYDEDDWEEEPEDEDDLDELIPKRTGEKDDTPFSNMLVIGLVGILILAGIGAIFFLPGIFEEEDDETDSEKYQDFGTGTLSEQNNNVMISELDTNNEWFEIFIKGPTDLSTSGWSFTDLDNIMVSFPEISGLEGNEHIIVHTGNGNDEISLEDGKAEIFLGIGGDVLGDENGEIALFDPSDNLLDFIGWGEGDGDISRENWSVEGYIDIPDEDGYTVSLQTDDLNNGSNWEAGPPSPGDFPIFDVPMDDTGNMTAQVQNGFLGNNTLSGEPGGKYFGLHYRWVKTNDARVDEDTRTKIKKWVKETYALMKEHFGEPEPTGYDGRGKPYLRIKVRQGENNDGIYERGEVRVTLGDNDVSNKQTIEHEVAHAFQAKADENGNRNTNPFNKSFIDEGLAEFWGKYSIKRSTGLTWKEIEDELESEGDISIYTPDDIEDDHISNWPEDENDAEPYYKNAFLFVKFIYDKYGLEKVIAIQKAIKNGGGVETEDEGDVLGIEAIEKAMGKKFSDLYQEFLLYKIENRFPQYKDVEDWPQYPPNFKYNFTGEVIDEDGTDVDSGVELYGTKINVYKMNGKDGVLTFKGVNGNSGWMFTIIIEHENGTKEYVKKELGRGDVGSHYIPHGVKTVKVLKTRLPGSTSVEEPYMMRLQPGPVITPERPFNDDHIMWDPPPVFEWNLSNFTENESLRFQISNSSTFGDPIDDISFPPDTMTYPVPESLPNGTYWWRLRWENDDVFGPWTDFRNFTIWDDPHPDIMWDPAPQRFINLTGSFQRIFPNSTVMLEEYPVPDDVTTDPGWGEFRLRGRGLPARTFNWTIGEEFPIGEYMEPGYVIFEWRVFFPPFENWPWFRDDIMWDPLPPELEIIEPLNNTRVNSNSTVRAETNSTWYTDSFFDIYYQLEEGNWQEYPVIPILVEEDGLQRIYEFEMDIKALTEGEFRLNFTFVDGYGRLSEPNIITIVVDRTAPEPFISWTPEREPPIFNEEFSVFISSTDRTAEKGIIEFGNPDSETFQMIDDEPTWDGEKETYSFMIDPDIYPGIVDGPLLLRYALVDDLGNNISMMMTIEIDRSSPIIDILSPSEGETWYTSTRYPVIIDVFEDQTDIPTISQAWVSLRCMENWTETVNITLLWVEMSIFQGEVLVPSWANIDVPWRIEVYVVDAAGNMGSLNREVILSDSAG